MKKIEEGTLVRVVYAGKTIYGVINKSFDYNSEMIFKSVVWHKEIASNKELEKYIIYRDDKPVVLKKNIFGKWKFKF